MLSKPSFRRSANCGRFDIMLSGTDLQKFPVESISSGNLNQEWIDRNGLEKPVLIKKAEGLGLKLPDSSSSLNDIAGIIGHDFPIKVIGVGEQTEISANIGEYAQYISNRTSDHKVLNLISLEVSATRLSSKVQSPTLVREVDWIDKCWPLDRRARGDFPQVQKYCLCGMAGSYTDFHVDFGGTSVWYHVLSGQKRFYLVAPTTINLRAFEQWTCSKSQDAVFFGDIVGHENCFQLDLLAGQTLLIPGAWIHAVHTPIDSLVFGGNFLHSFNILRQLQVYGIEQRTFVGKAYRFPHFKLVNWFVLCSLLPVAKKLLCAPDAVVKSGDASDSDDDNEDLISLCNSIKSPCVFRQFPYLVRTCQLWLLALDEEEHAAFTQAAQESWCDGNQMVIDSWWDLLLKVADLPSVGSLDERREACSRRRRHIERVRAVKVFDLLDESVVAAAFSDDSREEDDLEHEHDGEAEEVSALKSLQAPVLQAKEKGREQVQKPSLRIKLTLGGNQNKHDSTDIPDNTEEEKEEEEEEEGVGRGDNNTHKGAEEDKGEPSLRFKFQMPGHSTNNAPLLDSKSSRLSSTGTNEDNSSSTKFNISISSASAGSSSQSLLLKNRMAAQLSRMNHGRANQTAGLPISSRKNGVTVTKAASARRVRKIAEYESEDDDENPRTAPINHEFDTSNILPEKEGVGGGRYSTRGKRVSAAFLLHAEDVDIREMNPVNPNSDDDDAAPTSSKSLDVKDQESSLGGAGAGSLIDDKCGGDDEIPFMFDDDAGLPYGEEEWVAGKSDDEEDREEERSSRRDEKQDESDQQSNDESDEEDYRPALKKKRAPPVAQSAPAYVSLGANPLNRGRAVGKNLTNRQRLMAKFK